MEARFSGRCAGKWKEMKERETDLISDHGFEEGHCEKKVNNCNSSDICRLSNVSNHFRLICHLSSNNNSNSLGNRILQPTTYWAKSWE